MARGSRTAGLARTSKDKPESSMRYTAATFIALAATAIYLFSPMLLSRSAAPTNSPTATTEAALPAHILATHASYSPDKQHRSAVAPRPTLAYITPWNNKGYDVAKTFCGKFTHLSPVWFQVKPEAEKNKPYVIEGEHNVDAAWMAAVRCKDISTAVKPKILPRIMPEGDHLATIFVAEAEMERLSAAIVQLCKKHGFDGITFELWPRLRVTDGLRPILRKLVQVLGRQLHQNQLQLALVIPPYADSFNSADFAAVVDQVDLFSMNSYDHYNSGQPGPVAPYKWIKGAVTALNPKNEAQRAKILLGLNFYGYMYSKEGAEAVVGHAFLELMRAAEQKKSLQVTYDKATREHVFTVSHGSTKSVMYYPTERSLQERIQLAERLGCGITIWEIGQGLDHWMDLL